LTEVFRTVLHMPLSALSLKGPSGFEGGREMDNQKCGNAPFSEDIRQARTHASSHSGTSTSIAR
jgi:hypothetical protein